MIDLEMGAVRDGARIQGGISAGQIPAKKTIHRLQAVHHELPDFIIIDFGFQFVGP